MWSLAGVSPAGTFLMLFHWIQIAKLFMSLEIFYIFRWIIISQRTWHFTTKGGRKQGEKADAGSILKNCWCFGSLCSSASLWGRTESSMRLRFGINLGGGGDSGWFVTCFVHLVDRGWRCCWFSGFEGLGLVLLIDMLGFFPCSNCIVNRSLPF